MQITLGAFVIWSGKDAVINTAHVVNGALVLATSLLLTLRTFRVGFERLVQPIHGGADRTGFTASRDSGAQAMRTGAVGPHASRTRAAGISSRWRSPGSTSSSSRPRSSATRWPRATRSASCASAACCSGTGLVAGGASAFNQVLERDLDALMRRTRTRPLPDQRLQPIEGVALRHRDRPSPGCC